MSEDKQQVSQDNLPNFNQPDSNKMGLGTTPSTRSAELVAGARAEMTPSPETIALSRLSGKVATRFLTQLSGKSNVLWFFPARQQVIEILTERLLPPDKSNLRVVDVAAGFSPRGLLLARKYPNAEVIEIDLPEMVEEKKKRLEKGEIAIPSNLQWLGADLGKENLSTVLGGRNAHLITSEGLTLYLTPDEMSRLFTQAAASLSPNGVFITEMYFRDKIQHIRQAPQTSGTASFILRMVGSVPGAVADSETAVQRLSDAGFVNIETHSPVDIMVEHGQPPPIDVISVMTARKPAPAPVN